MIRAPGPTATLGYGLLTRPGVRRVLTLAGYPLAWGWPRGDWVAVWGQRPSAQKGETLARVSGRQLLRIEDAFLTGLAPRRGRFPPYGLFIDRLGVHYDARSPSEIERLLATHPLDDPDLLSRAARAMNRLNALGGGKYLGHDSDAVLPPGGHILVVDQVLGDASVRASGATRATFLEMLATARRDWPDRPLVVRAHPGGRGHLAPSDLTPTETWETGHSAPARTLARTEQVYTVSSGLGLDAIWAGLRPRVFGTPIYSGWGLTEDRGALSRRGRPLSPQQLFAALMILAPIWYDPFRDRLTDLDTILDIAEAETRAAREDRDGYTAHGISLWKRGIIARAFGGKVRYQDRPSPDRPTLAWASAPAPSASRVVRVEDGFLRSRGLGARLTPPVSLIADPTGGVYYDPSRPSLVETLIADSPRLPPEAHTRAATLIERITREAQTKYGQRGARPALPEGRKILVVGQVENDASILCGCTGSVKTNAALLAAARAERPDAVLLYKPHPDVEAGLRPGAIPAQEADLILRDTDPAWLMGQIDGLWTMTSLMGFEALLRGVPVTCLGAPFYAGWGLTEDRAPTPERRRTRANLTGLAHAALIRAPRYFDPKTGRACSVEIALDLIAASPAEPRPLALRLAAKAQGVWVTVKPR